MTSDHAVLPAEPRRHGPLGPLGRRLFFAFLLVALSSVITLSVAAVIGTGQGLSSARQADRERVTNRAADWVGFAYRSAGGWENIDLRPARAIAEGVGAQLIVFDQAGSLVVGSQGDMGQGGMGGGSTPGPMRRGKGQGGETTGRVVTAPVVSGSKQVGSVRLRFPTPTASDSKKIAWGWISVAAVVALFVALVVSWYVTHWLSDPLRGVARTAREIAAGNRAARTGVTAPGEIGELARAFDNMADEVHRAERNRRNLAADVAHELRTPLSALQAGLEELRDGLAEPEPARLAALHDQALRLGRIVGDLADLAAAESAALSLHLERLDLGDLVAAVLADREPELRAAGMEIDSRLRRGVLINGDPGRLHQAFGNILANAARYCRPGDSVSVRVHGEGGGTAVVEIADTGPGIPAADLPYVFDRLWRGRSSGGVSGSGIGLAVVRELITAHGGTVIAASNTERSDRGERGEGGEGGEGGEAAGTVFTVRLPAVAVPMR